MEKDGSLSQTVWCSRWKASGQAGSAVLLARQTSVHDAVGLGEMANLAVLGGNLPPGRAHDDRSPFSARVVRTAGAGRPFPPGT